MVAVAPALNLPEERAQHQYAGPVEVPRWGAPIWAADEVAPRNRRVDPDAIPLDVWIRIAMRSTA